MTSTATDRLGFDKMARADDYNTWDTTVNLNYDLLDEAIAGVVSIAISGGNYTLSDTDYASCESRNAMIVIASADAARSIIIPSEERVQSFHNKSTYAQLIKTSGGTGTVVLGSQLVTIYCDGTECYRISNSGWGLASTTATTSGADVTIDTTVTGEEFSDVMFVFEGVSTSSTGDLVITMAGMSGSATLSGVFADIANTHGGTCTFLNARATSGVGHIGLYPTATQVVLISGLAGSYGAVRWALSTGITTVTFNPAGNWDAGSIQLWMR